MVIDTEFPGWSTYLKSIGAQAAPESLFEPVEIQFRYKSLIGL